MFPGAYQCFSQFDAGTEGNVMLACEAGDGIGTNADAARLVEIVRSVYLPVVPKGKTGRVEPWGIGALSVTCERIGHVLPVFS